MDPDAADDAPVQASVWRLHRTPHRMVYAFAGAGSLALAWLHAAAGSSRTVLEAYDHYHPASLAEALGARPARAASPEVAVELALRAQRRARHLVHQDPAPAPVFGLGLAGTIATDRRKRGSHRVHVATADALGVARHDLVLKAGARDRHGEERLAGELVLHEAAAASGLLGWAGPRFLPTERPIRAFHPSAAMRAFLADPHRVLALDAAGLPVDAPFGQRGPRGAAERTAPPAILSGSFHPLHDGHLRLAEAAAAHLGREVWFEMPLRNADKAGIDAGGARERAAQLAGLRPLLLTHLPLFADKAERLGAAVFVIGADTAERVLEPRFYGGAEGMQHAMERVRAAGCRFLVAGRRTPDGFRSVDALDVPRRFQGLFEPLPGFRVDLSSSQLRESWA